LYESSHRHTFKILSQPFFSVPAFMDYESEPSFTVSLFEVRFLLRRGTAMFKRLGRSGEFSAPAPAAHDYHFATAVFLARVRRWGANLRVVLVLVVCENGLKKGSTPGEYTAAGATTRRNFRLKGAGFAGEAMKTYTVCAISSARGLAVVVGGSW
jgi:hypothetical protein